MAYDLVFWTDARDPRPEPSKIYLELLRGNAVEGLGPFETPSVLAALGLRFPGMVPPPAASRGWTAWESPDQTVVFEFTWTPQYLVASARGAYTNDQMNEVVDICVDVGGGRLYDPQTDERFDSQ